MTHIVTFPVRAPAPHKPASRLARLLGAFRLHHRPAMIDLDSAPEHLLRDLGFIDGRGGSLRHPPWPYDARGWR